MNFKLLFNVALIYSIIVLVVFGSGYVLYFKRQTNDGTFKPIPPASILLEKK